MDTMDGGRRRAKLPLMAYRRLLLAVVCSSVVGCAGIVIDDQKQAATNLGPEGTADAAPAGDDGTGCQVLELNATTPSGGGPTVYTTQLSDPVPEATRAFIDSDASGMFTVTCLAGATVKVKATFGPYKGFATYELPAGAFELGGKRSDRTCSVDISNGLDGTLRGFFSCPKEPYADGNVFSRSGMPIGLGAFDAKVR